MARLRTTLAANFAGAGWAGVMQLICVPLFIKLMGIEAYGLIGFYLSLQAALQVLDFGLSPTLNRELARYSAQSGTADEARDFVRTLELIYWGIGLAIGAGIVLAAPAIAGHWLQASALRADELERIVALMGGVIAVQWPLSFYQGGLTGLQRLVVLNAIRIVAVTLGYGGAVAILWSVSGSAQAFFLWQLGVGVLQVLLLAVALWSGLPRGTRATRFDPARLRGIRAFAGGMSVIALAGIVVNQLDKLVLSRFLPLEVFGYYMLATVVASALQLFITPIFSAVFPRLSAMVVAGDGEGIRRLYHAGTQLMAALVLPTAIVLGAFAPEVIRLWTGDAALATRAAPIAVLLLTGTAINGLMNLPYALQLAHGWTRIGSQFALFKLVVFVPVLVWAAANYGAMGGAATWAALNATYLALAVPLTHRRLLPGEATPWLIRDVGGPLVAVALVVVLARSALDGTATGLGAALQLAVVGGAALAAAAVAAPELRASLLGSWLQFRRVHR